MASTAGSGRKGQATGKTAPGTAGPKKSGARATAGRAPARSRTPAKGREAEQGLHMHTAHPSIPIPYVTREDLTANVRAAEGMLPGVKLPPPERLAFYGGLGALAVVGAVEWPVAAAIGVATVVARRGRRERG